MSTVLFGNFFGDSGSTCTRCGWTGPYYRVDGATELAEADAQQHRAEGCASCGEHATS